jgi:PPOX class probable F420-dependent enzyme
MANLNDAGVQELLEKPNHAVLSTINKDGSVHSAVVWLNVEDGALAINSSRGRAWPTNLERDARATLVVLNQENPYEYLEIKGRAAEAGGAEEHIDALAMKYINQERYPWRQPGEERVKFRITPERIRHAKA